MARLIAKEPIEAFAPLAPGGTTLAVAPVGEATAIAPFRGRERKVSAALRTLGLGFPGPGRTLRSGAARILWWGRAQALLLGAAAPAELAGLAALTAQGDGLAGFALEGPLAESALARLVPLDLRPGAFPKDATARTLLFHMTCSVTRTGPQGFEILVMRSMAGTAAHDLAGALRSVAAQA